MYNQTSVEWRNVREQAAKSVWYPFPLLYYDFPALCNVNPAKESFITCPCTGSLKKKKKNLS